MSRTLLTIALAAFTLTTNAAPLSVVHSSECDKLQQTSVPFMLVLKKGESIGPAIIQCVKAAKLPGVSFTALGALKDVNLNFFNVATKQYQNKLFPQVFELDSMTGNVAESKDGMVAHMHGILSDDNYQVRGGHIKSAVVAATAEITMIPYKGKLEKKMDNETGVALLTAG